MCNLGNRDSIEGIENNIKKEYPVHFSTNHMGWEADGLTILRPTGKKPAVAATDRDTMELGFKKGKPYILVNNELLSHKSVPEWLFVHVVLLAAGRIKNRPVNKTTDLLFPPGSSLGEQILHDIRDFFEAPSLNLKSKVLRRDMLPSDGSGNVLFQLFQQDSITIDRSVRWFESQHMAGVETMVEEKLQSPDTLEAEDDLRRSHNLRDLDSLDFEYDLTHGDKVGFCKGKEGFKGCIGYRGMVLNIQK